MLVILVITAIRILVVIIRAYGMMRAYIPLLQVVGVWPSAFQGPFGGLVLNLGTLLELKV